MICTGACCDRKERCGLYYMNPQPEYRKNDNLQNLANFGWCSISSDEYESHWACGPCGDYAMFEQLSEQMCWEQIANKANAFSCTSFRLTPEQVKEALERFEELYGDNNINATSSM